MEQGVLDATEAEDNILCGTERQLGALGKERIIG